MQMTLSLQIKDYNHSFSHSVGRNGGRSTGGKFFVQLFFVHGRLWLMMVEMSTRRGWGSIQPIQPSHLFILELNSRARLFCEAVGRVKFSGNTSGTPQWESDQWESVQWERLFCEAVARKVHGEKKTFQRRLGKKIDVHGICP